LRQELWAARSRAFLEHIQEIFKQIVNAFCVFRFQDLFTEFAPITPGALTHRNTSESSLERDLSKSIRFAISVSC
jgi:hypothetical protein